MLEQRNFPAKHNNNAGKKQAPCKEITNKQHRGKHHKMAPIKNPTIHATFILNKKTLKRTPNHDTDQVAHIVKDR